MSEESSEFLSIEEKALLELTNGTGVDEVIPAEEDLNSNNEQVKGEDTQEELEPLKIMAARRSLMDHNIFQDEQASSVMEIEQVETVIVVNDDLGGNQSDSEKGSLSEDESSSYSEKSDTAGEREEVVDLMSNVLENKPDELLNASGFILKQKNELIDDLSPSVDEIGDKQSDGESLDIDNEDFIESLSDSGEGKVIKVKSNKLNLDDEQDNEKSLLENSFEYSFESSEEDIVDEVIEELWAKVKTVTLEEVTSIAGKYGKKKFTSLRFTESYVVVVDESIQCYSWLYLFTQYNRPDIVQFLLENGADPHLVSACGKTPIALAKESKNDNLMALFGIKKEEIEKLEPSSWPERVFVLSAASFIAYVAWSYLGYKSSDKEQLPIK